MTETRLTDKQEAFVNEYVNNGFNATKAAIAAGYSEKGARQTASETMAKPYIQEAIEELKAVNAEYYRVTTDSLMRELEEARELAIKTGNPASMINASMGKAKLTGLDKPVEKEIADKPLQIVFKQV